jgi:hypothetical protein
LNLLTATSLLIVVGTSVLWVRGRYYRQDLSLGLPGGHALSAFTEPNRLTVEYSEHGDVWLRIQNRPTRGLSFVSHRHGVAYQFSNPEVGSYTIHWSPHGSRSFLFGWADELQPADNTYPITIPPAWSFRAAIPFWFIMLLALILPAWRLWASRRRRRRTREGQCQVCGYDLHATPERCPECGTVPASSAADALHAGDGRDTGT